jgi:hypothetical protein
MITRWLEAVVSPGFFPNVTRTTTTTFPPGTTFTNPTLVRPPFLNPIRTFPVPSAAPGPAVATQGNGSCVKTIKVTGPGFLSFQAGRVLWCSGVTPLCFDLGAFSDLVTAGLGLPRMDIAAGQTVTLMFSCPTATQGVPQQYFPPTQPSGFYASSTFVPPGAAQGYMAWGRPGY